MVVDIKRKRRIEGLIGTWSFLIFWWFFFGIIGILVAGWFQFFNDWWITFVGGILLIGAIAETIRFTAMKRGKRKRLESLITSWSFFLFFTLLFFVIGILLANWWSYDAWWVWLIIGLSFMGSISSTIRFFVYREIEPIVTKATSIVVEEVPEPVKETSKFCQSCGQQVEGTEKFCANCGALVV
ncbi:MAG: zinc ribbon domain-containing protein [Candidatus Heimdallarchaeota archaeon]|nr:MAG: zinc ribbon domain-containing protein [Candidatus Heimdallarchaeota archaeon]